MITICAWCPTKTTYRDSCSSEWKAITKAVLEYVASPGSAKEISHGICPSCYEVAISETEFEERRKDFLEVEHTNTPRGDGAVEGAPPIVKYCLQQGCEQTCWHGIEHWEVSVDRTDGMRSGKYEAIFGPFCPSHNKKAKAKEAAA